MPATAVNCLPLGNARHVAYPMHMPDAAHLVQNEESTSHDEQGEGVSTAANSSLYKQYSPFSNRGDSAAELGRGASSNIPHSAFSEPSKDEPPSEVAPRKGTLDPEDPEADCNAREEVKWWRQQSVRMALIGSGFCAFIFNVLKELAPIFASAPRDKVCLLHPLISLSKVAFVI